MLYVSTREQNAQTKVKHCLDTIPYHEPTLFSSTLAIISVFSTTYWFCMHYSGYLLSWQFLPAYEYHLPQVKWFSVMIAKTLWTHFPFSWLYRKFSLHSSTDCRLWSLQRLRRWKLLHLLRRLGTSEVDSPWGNQVQEVLHSQWCVELWVCALWDMESRTQTIWAIQKYGGELFLNLPQLPVAYPRRLSSIIST